MALEGGVCGLMDKAPDFGSGDCRFESCHARDTMYFWPLPFHILCQCWFGILVTSDLFLPNICLHIRRLHLSYMCIYISLSLNLGDARTQSPTFKNCAIELPTFGVIVGVSLSQVQWTSLTLEEPPS